MAWSMKKERELIQLAREDVSVEQIANRMKFAPAAIIKAGRRLGLHLSRSSLSETAG